MTFYILLSIKSGRNENLDPDKVIPPPPKKKKKKKDIIIKFNSHIHI